MSFWPVRLRNRSLSLPLFLALSSLPAPGADSSTSGTAPAKNWFLPLFTKEGFHWTTLSGDEVHSVGSDRIDVVNLKIFRFSGDAAARPTTILLSPEASYFPKENRASGPTDMRLIREDVEITGEDWSYEQVGEKISLHRNVRVVFHEKIKSMLK